MTTHLVGPLVTTIQVVGIIFVIGGGLLIGIYFLVWSIHRVIRLLGFGSIMIDFILHRKAFKHWLSTTHSTDL